jgi:hypothetical protein
MSVPSLPYLKSTQAVQSVKTTFALLLTLCEQGRQGYFIRAYRNLTSVCRKQTPPLFLSAKYIESPEKERKRRLQLTVTFRK